MNNEIKEILDKLNSALWEKDEEEITYKILFSNEVYKLLDYITNLQKTNKNHSKKLIELGNKITNLQQTVKDTKDTADDILYELKQENERLKEDLKGQEALTLSFSNVSHDYYTRIEKASEYIKKHQRKDEFLNLNEWQTRDLLNILQNGSENDD